MWNSNHNSIELLNGHGKCSLPDSKIEVNSSGILSIIESEVWFSCIVIRFVVISIFERITIYHWPSHHHHHRRHHPNHHHQRINNGKPIGLHVHHHLSVKCNAHNPFGLNDRTVPCAMRENVGSKQGEKGQKSKRENE